MVDTDIPAVISALADNVNATAEKHFRISPHTRASVTDETRWNRHPVG